MCLMNTSGPYLILTINDNINVLSSAASMEIIIHRFKTAHLYNICGRITDHQQSAINNQ